MKQAKSRDAAFTFVEFTVGAAIGSLLMAALFAGAVAVQRCYLATEDFANAKTDQLRLIDYMALDVRRGLSVEKGGAADPFILRVRVPDYYDSDGEPRDPVITNYVANYGNPATPVVVTYRKVGDVITRQEGTNPPMELATDVADFRPEVFDLGRVVKAEVTFAPKFQKFETAAARKGTAVYSTTLLRNAKRTY